MTKRFTLEFTTGNDAFDGDEDGEIVRILRRVIMRIEDDSESLNHPVNVRDTDGNIVGTLTLKEEK